MGGDKFFKGKWRHVGTKIGSKIDANFERPILQKLLKNNMKFQCFFQGYGVEVGSKNHGRLLDGLVRQGLPELRRRGGDIQYVLPDGSAG